MIWFPSRFGLPSNEGGTLGQLAKCRELSVEQWNAAEDSPSASVTTSLPSDPPPPRQHLGPLSSPTWTAMGCTPTPDAEGPQGVSLAPGVSQSW